MYSRLILKLENLYFVMVFIVQEFITVCKNLTPQQVEDAFNKFDTSGDQR